MTVRELFANKKFWLFILMMLCSGASEQAVAQWASAFAEQGLGVSKTVGDMAGLLAFAALMGTARALYGKFGEKLNMERFSALGVIEETTRRPMEEVDSFFTELEGIFQKEEFTKAEIVEALKKFLPNFEHEEKGKNLDQKM